MLNTNELFHIIGDASIDIYPSLAPEAPSPIGSNTIVPNIDVVAAGSAGHLAQALATCFDVTNFGLHVNLGDPQDDCGDFWIARMHRAGIPVRYIRRQETQRTGTSIVRLLSNGECCFETVYGANAARLDLSLDDFGKTNVLVLTGFCQTPGLWIDSTIEALAAYKANKQNLVLLDPNWDDDPRAIAFLRKTLPYVDMFFPNQHELCRLSGTLNVREAARSLAETYDTTVITTLGINGCLIADVVEGLKHYPVSRNDFKNTNGAGDFFLAAFLFYYLQTGKQWKCWSAMKANRLAEIAVQHVTFADKLQAVRSEFLADSNRTLFAWESLSQSV